MADIRTLKLQLLADTAQFQTGLNKAQDDTSNFSSKIGGYVSSAAKAFVGLATAAGSAAFAIGVTSVKAAIEDEKAQRNLSKTLENVIGATKDQTKAVEDYITKQSLSLGISDEKLRPAYARLIRSTKDTAETQKALNLAMDISSATGKDLDSVASALGKAYDGNTASLGKLGLGIDSTILKSGDMDLITKELGKTFKGFAEQEANTVEGQFRRIGIAVDEAKESLGAALLPILSKIAEFINREVVPAIQGLVDGLTGKGSIREATIKAGGNLNLLKDDFDASYESGVGLGEAFRNLADSIGIIGGNSANANPEFSKFVDNITRLVESINSLFDALSKIKSIGSDILNFVGLQGVLGSVGNLGAQYNPLYQGGLQTNQKPIEIKIKMDPPPAKKTISSVNSAVKVGIANKFNANTVLR